MIEVLSGNIVSGVRYTVANTVDQTGYITYLGVDYTHGLSFVGQTTGDVYTTSDVNMKVYEDNSLTDIQNQTTASIEDELSPYPESTTIISQILAENFSESGVVYPESTIIVNQVTAARTLQVNTQIIRKKR